MATATAKKLTIKPLEDRVVVQPFEAEERTAGGIVLPDTAREKPMRGKVTATGPGKLIEKSGERARMFLTNDLPDEYQVDLVAERVQGKDAFAIGIVVGGRTTSILLDAYGGKASGLHLVGEVGCDRNPTSYQKPATLLSYGASSSTASCGCGISW